MTSLIYELIDEFVGEVESLRSCQRVVYDAEGILRCIFTGRDVPCQGEKYFGLTSHPAPQINDLLTQ